MGRKNKNTLQVSMFDESGSPAIDYGTTSEDIDKIFKNIPKKEPNHNITIIVEPTKSNLVESFKPKEDMELEKRVPIPFDFYDTGLVDAITTRKKFDIKSGIEFYFHVLDGDSGYKKFINYLPHIEKYFTRFFGWDGDKKYLRENRGFKRNTTDRSTIEGRAKQDRTNQFIKVVERLKGKGISYYRGDVYTGTHRFSKDGLCENKDTFIKYPHEERIPRLEKWMNGEEYEGEKNEQPKGIGKVIEEIDISREAGFDDEGGLAGFVPFCFDSKGFVNHNETLKEYTLKECINFYLKVKNKESNYGRFSNLLSSIEEYFSKTYRWDGNIESMTKYKDLIGNISNNCADKVIIGFDGELDLYAMNNRFGDKDTLNYVENILKNKEPFNDFTVLMCLNKFLEREGLSHAVNVFNKNKENLIYFFKEIIEQSELNKFNYEIESLGLNMWDSYRIFFNEIFNSFDNFLENKEDDFYDKNSFDSGLEYKYPNMNRESRENYGNTIWYIINDLLTYSPDIVENISLIGIDFLTRMFASFKKSKYEADIDSVYKKNLIRVYMSGKGKNINIKGWIEQDQIIRLKEFLADNLSDLKYRKGYVYDLEGRKIYKDEILKYPEDKRKDELIARSMKFNEESTISTEEDIGTISFLNNIIDDLKLEGRIEIDDSEDHLFDKDTGEILNFVDLFQEERDCWKIRIIERMNGGENFYDEVLTGDRTNFNFGNGDEEEGPETSSDTTTSQEKYEDPYDDLPF